MTDGAPSPQIGYYEGPEHRCELLVRIIQSREGAPSKDEREEAFSELLEMFRPLIKSIASKVYKVYGKGLRTDWGSFYHDTIATAVEMVLDDYIPKKNGGKAMFAPYLQTKLYYRTLWRAQKTIKQYERELPITFDKELWDLFTDSPILDRQQEEFIRGQIDNAILSQVTDKELSVFDTVIQNQLRIRLKKLNQVAHSKLTKKELFIWHSTLFSGMNINEIALSLNKDLVENEHPWTKQRVHNFYHKIRVKVLAAYGEAALAGEV